MNRQKRKKRRRRCCCVFLVFFYVFIFDILSGVTNISVCDHYQEKQDVFEDEDNTDDNRTVGGEYSNKESGEVAEQGGDEQFSETPNTAENICVTSDSPHPSESSHGGKPPLQSLKYGGHCDIISCDSLLFQEKEAVV